MSGGTAAPPRGWPRKIVSPPIVTLAILLVLAASLAGPIGADGLGAVLAGEVGPSGPLADFAGPAAFLLLSLGIVAVHECGHILAGKIVGFRFVGCAVGPIVLIVRTRRVSLGLHWGWHPIGWAASMPTRWHAVRWRRLVMIVGGPLAELLAGVAVLRLATRPELTGGIQPLLIALAYGTFLDVVFNLLPIKTFALVHDGLHLQRLLLNTAAVRRECAYLTLFSAARAGQPSIEWDPGCVAEATALADNSAEHLFSCVLAFLWAQTRDDDLLAGQYLDRAAAAARGAPAVSLLPADVYARTASHAMFGRGDAVAARALLDRAAAEPAVRAQSRYLHTDAAILLAEGRPAEAHARAVESLVTLERGQDAYPRDDFATTETAIRQLIVACERARSRSPEVSAAPLAT